MTTVPPYATVGLAPHQWGLGNGPCFLTKALAPCPEAGWTPGHPEGIASGQQPGGSPGLCQRDVPAWDPARPAPRSWPRPRARGPAPAPVAPPPVPVAPPRTSAAGSAAPATSPRPRSCGSTPSTWSTPPTSRRWRPRRPPGCWMWGCCPRRQAPRMVRRLGPRQAGHPGQNSHRPGHSDVSEGHGGDSQGLKGT